VLGATRPEASKRSLVEDLSGGLGAPICLTWELTYACNLSCLHCLSSSGRRDPSELTTAECFAVVDQMAEMGVFYVNVGGGEPMLRRDFVEVLDYAVGVGVGVKFSTNGRYIDAAAARRFAGTDYLDIQISLDGATEAVNDAVRGAGSYRAALTAMGHLHDAGFGPFKVSVVATRHNIDQLDDFESLAAGYGAQLRVTRLRPSGRGAVSWHDLRPTQDQQRLLHRWLLERPQVLTGDSFFHLSALGEQLPGLNLCGAGRVVCLIDPVGDVYACPFVIHDRFKAGNVRDHGGFPEVWRNSELFEELRRPGNPGACSSCGSYDACRGGCMASKFFVGLDVDDPDPECVHGAADELLERDVAVPHPVQDHSRTRVAPPARRRA
jgi:mycofactocin radical SAM maturase